MHLYLRRSCHIVSPCDKETISIGNPASGSLDRFHRDHNHGHHRYVRNLNSGTFVMMQNYPMLSVFSPGSGMNEEIPGIVWGNNRAISIILFTVTTIVLFLLMVHLPHYCADLHAANVLTIPPP
jgi:hypothetical protein